MLANRCRQVLATSTDFAVWDAVKKLNATLSSGNKTATANVGEQFSRTISDKTIVASMYAEITATHFGVNQSAILLTPYSNTLTNDNTLPTNAVRLVYSTNPASVYGVSYNPATGSYQFRKDNVLISSGIVPNNTLDLRLSWQGGAYFTFATATLNTGATAFTYTPVYI